LVKKTEAILGVKQRSINIAYANEYYHPMIPLSKSSESSEHLSNSNDTSDLASFGLG
jgi:hypothetical protein